MADDKKVIQQEQDQQRLFASKISLYVGLTIMLLKFFAYRVTNSESILSDALESIVNVVAAFMVIVTIKYSSKPADKDHPYGHGKMEFFSAAFEGGLISFASLLIIVESSTALLYGHIMHDLGHGLVIIIVAGIGNLLLGWYLLHKGKALQSIALQSSGKHVLSDVWTSVGIIVGLALVHLTGWVWLDAVIALSFGLYLGYVGFSIVADASGGLMDKEDPEVIEKITQALKPHMNNGIIDIHEMKVIRSGRYHHIDMHLVLPDHWTIAQTHERIKTFEEAVLNDYLFDGEMNFHYDPCRIKFCSTCDLKACDSRQAPFEPAEKGISIRQSQIDDGAE
ncbi:MAG: cation diffusion facilitator family transporter [Pseudomonadota bacterium]|nr:cation diffusion facilitator family transporter [Pseudomonadota bacterium]